MKFLFINLGCKINQIEMEQISYNLVKMGYEYTDDTFQCDFILINTCTVTAKADKKSLQAIKKYSQFKKLKYIFVTGCYSELEPELSKKIHPKNKIIAQKNKQQLPKIIDSLFREQHKFTQHESVVGERFSMFKSAKVSSQSLENEQVDFFKHTRAFLKIQDGCNAFCSYCRIPFARGAPVSRSYANIMEHLKRLKTRGIKEIVLSGINIGKYQDSQMVVNFTKLLFDILEEAGDIRIKISSIEPFSLDNGFFDLVAHPNIAAHIHLPLQGLSDKILKRMNRRYRLEDYRMIVDRIYRVRPDFSIATDVIVGYPGETDVVYENGKKFLESCGISKIHVFPFSLRPFTSDFENLKGYDSKNQKNNVSEVVKKERSKDLRNFSRYLETSFLKKIKNMKQNIILESQVKNIDYPLKKGVWYQGTTEYNLKGVVSVSQSMQREKSKIVFRGQSPNNFNEYNLQGKNLSVKVSNLNPLIFEPI